MRNFYAIGNITKMIKITFPKKEVTVRQRAGVNELFDIIRKKWINFSPEEWVRQHMIHYLLSKKYPATLMAIEKQIKLGELTKRCDIVVYSRNNTPFMIIECKEMKVALSQKALDQVLLYHSVIQAKYLIITNGVYCFGFQKMNGQFSEIDEFPEYSI